ncbi:MAG: non-canonical purine NTP diphosphatase [Paludibacter sp.]|jgi:XTP/dITP diphosphohydrolase|nr:non-canonical purine NTP diphosphatase [Paludibacter sp.]
MRKLVFATNNSHKLEEVSAVLGDQLDILSLKEIGCTEDIPETATTLEGNALLKAQHVYNQYGYDCFADDTGLEVEALEGRPGVYSARYAGEDQNAERNMEKLLHELEGSTNRRARFRTVVALIEGGNVRYFEGQIAGQIIGNRKGSAGFGYDPVFVPDGYSQTFAELGSELKNKISHRALAIQALIKYLKQQ